MEPEELRSRIGERGHHVWRYAFLKNDKVLDGEIV